MAIVPAGMISLPLSYLRATIAESAAFQSWTGTADAAAALLRIFPVATESVIYPLCLVDWADNFKRSMDAAGSRNYFRQDGDLAMIFMDIVDPAHDETEASYDFMNKVGAVIDEMESYAGKPGYLDIQSIAIESGPMRPKLAEVESTALDYYQVNLVVEYRGG